MTLKLETTGKTYGAFAKKVQTRSLTPTMPTARESELLIGYGIASDRTQQAAALQPLKYNKRRMNKSTKSPAALQGDFGALQIDIPRDRQGTFEPQIIAKHQTRWSGFGDENIALYAQGLSVREIYGHLNLT